MKTHILFECSEGLHRVHSVCMIHSVFLSLKLWLSTLLHMCSVGVLEGLELLALCNNGFLQCCNLVDVLDVSHMKYRTGQKLA